MSIQQLTVDLASEDAQTRINASDALCAAAEQGEDVSAAIPAAGAALSDTEEAVRANTAWLVAFLAEHGVDLSAILSELAGALTATPLPVRSNAAWAIRCTATKSDVSAVIPALVEALADKEAGANASGALACSVTFEASREASCSSLEEALEHESPDVVLKASALLGGHYGGLREWDRVQALVQDPKEWVRFGALVGVVRAAKIGEAPPKSLLECVGSCLGDEGARIRIRAATTLIEVAELGYETEAALPALAAALVDGELQLRKESIWALYCAARNGTDLGDALAPLEQCLVDPDSSVRGNAAIGVGRHYLNAGRLVDALALLEKETFGAAWAFADHCCMTGDKEPLKRIVRTLQPGFGARDQGIRRGIATAIHNAADKKPDGSRAVQAVQEVLSELPDEPIAQSAVGGIFMALRQLQRR